MFENIHNFIIYNSTVEINSISPNLNKPKKYIIIKLLKSMQKRNSKATIGGRERHIPQRYKQYSRFFHQKYEIQKIYRVERNKLLTQKSFKYKAKKAQIYHQQILITKSVKGSCLDTKKMIPWDTQIYKKGIE